MDVLIIREVELPYTVGGATIIDENGDYNVYINSRLSPDRKVKAFRHEIDHIRKNHFGSDKTVAEKESEIKCP